MIKRPKIVIRCPESQVFFHLPIPHFRFSAESSAVLWLRLFQMQSDNSMHIHDLLLLTVSRIAIPFYLTLLFTRAGYIRYNRYN